MVRKKDQEEHLFAPDKIDGLLDGGLEELDAGERQLLSAVAETKLMGGYKPTRKEKEVLDRLGVLSGDEYDSRDVKRKVKKMVKGRKKADTAPLSLPPMFSSLLSRFRRKKKQDE